MARPGIYSDLVGLKRPTRLGNLLKVAMFMAVLALLVRVLLDSDPPVEYRDHIAGQCVAIELDGRYYACTEDKFQGLTMESVPVEPGTTLIDLQRQSSQK